MISNNVFDRVVGRAQASKRLLKRLENDVPGTQNEAKMGPGGLRGWFGRRFGVDLEGILDGF